MKESRPAALFLFLDDPLLTSVSNFQRYSLPFLVAVIVVTLVLAYLPGLSGAFLFDDFANLPSLGIDGGVRSGDTFVRYLTSGHADPTGRPVALLSFLVDARNWPADPFSFKRTNLILHFINACLLGLVLNELGQTHGLERDRARLAAAIASGLWALHPFLVSTVLYVVQREAMLPATFTLLGMLCWLRARQCATARSMASLAWIVAGIGGCTALATLSKANGLLLPLLILVSEATLPIPMAGFRRRLMLLLGPVGAAVLTLLVATAIRSIGQGPIPVRGWTVFQRLMTEPTILFDYLAQLWLVKSTDSSLLHDGMTVARSLWDPWYTAASIAGCTLLIVAGFAMRRRWPFLSLSILFFFTGHLMESSSLALELYFDHRNYLPAMPMFWPLAIMVTSIRSRWILSTTMYGGLVALATLTSTQASIWGSSLTQGLTWASAHPESARAQAFAAQTEAMAGLLAPARLRIDSAALRFTDEPQIALNLIDIHCNTGGVSPSDVTYTSATLQQASREPGPLLLSWFTLATAKADSDRCPGLGLDDLRRMLDAAEANPTIRAIPGRMQDIEHIHGLIALSQQSPEQAAAWFKRSLDRDPNPATALNQAALLGSAGRPDLGLTHLQYLSLQTIVPRHRPSDGMPWVHDRVLARQRYWENEIKHLSEALARGAKETP